MKRALKQVAECVVARVAPLAWGLRHTPRLLVLMYHRVLPADHPDRRTEQPGMYVSPQTLAMHLEVLRERGFELVHLDDWLSAAANKRSLPVRACAITFDDGWRDNYDYAYPVLKRARAPATIYLVSDLVGTRYSFWPNSLARLLAARGMSARQIDEAIMEYKATRSDAQMLALVESGASTDGAPGAPPGETLPGADRDLMSWAEIEEMKASGFVRFGSHTRRHTRLSGVDSAVALQDEVIGSREVLERRLGEAPRTFCYPNGDTSTAAVELVRSAYNGAVTTQRGWHSPGEDPFLIRRVGVHEDIGSRPDAFLARVSGWL